MSTGSKQIIKTQKSKFKKNQDKETLKQFRKKHHDKSTYRLMKDEGKDYDR
jgi:hypothetical protein